jgi:xanthine dehydrogenase accessory factor
LPFDVVLAEIQPAVLIDARMRKRSIPECQRGLAPVTIGLGPNFEAGSSVDFAIETAWGTELGRVIRSGRTRNLEGEPMPMAGFARERYVYSPAAGVFRTSRTIGARVSAGERVGEVDGAEVCAPLTGYLRGLTHDGATVAVGTKIVEIDASADCSRAYGLGKRPSLIARGVCEALGIDAHGIGDQ